jgi:hypothetical protein
MTYKMMFKTDTIELPWEYTIEMHSDRMALDYAARHAIVLKHDLVVFKQEADGEYSFLGEIRVDVKVVAKIVTGSKS